MQNYSFIMKNNITFTPGLNGPKLLPQLCRKRTSTNLLVSIDEDNSTFQLFLLSKKSQHTSSIVIQVTHIVNAIPHKSIKGWNQKAQLEI